MGPENSLTLDLAARERAAAALSTAIGGGGNHHFCREWTTDGSCGICWAIAAEVIRAAEGLKTCEPCGGGGLVPPGSVCPECGGDGLDRLTGA